MASNLPILGQTAGERWRMPVVPERYDQCPLSEEEHWALDQLVSQPSSQSKASQMARQLLARFNEPIADVYHLRHQWEPGINEVHRIIRQEMWRLKKTFWEWTSEEWIAFLCPTTALFRTTQPKSTNYSYRSTLLDMAYLLGGATDLRAAGIDREATSAANAYFGADRVTEQCQCVLDVLVGSKELGYKAGPIAISQMRRYMSLLFILQRSPSLEEATEEMLTEAATVGTEPLRWAKTKTTIALRRLGLLPPAPQAQAHPPKQFDSSGMAPEWYAWCHAWYERAVDLTPDNRASYMSRLLAVGRWLNEKAPEVRTPEQWTEDLALRFRVDVCSWTNGQYSSDLGQHLLQKAGKLGKPMVPRTIAYHLTVLRRFLYDLVRRPHPVGGAQPRRMRLDFSPIEVLTTPRHIRQLMDLTSPRDIDLRTWARLAIAAATLSASDLPQGTAAYPLSLYRALALIWVTSARRPNEIVRLRLDCVRADVAPELLGEGDQVIEYLTILAGGMQQTNQEGTSKAPLLHYLHVPSGKTRGPFYIWIPAYVVEAIEAWKQERP